MNQTIQRGLLAVRADAGTLDVKATVDALNKAFADFKAEHTRQLDDIRKGLPGADQAAKVDKISAHAEHFSQLEDDEKHRIRKQVKQLRYSIEFLASLLDAKALKTYLKKLKAVQENLGHYNDLVVAETLFLQAPEPETAYSFAAGWIAAEKNRMLKLVEQELRLFSQTKKLK